ncbi:DUF3558 domain-containing protein [Amycolatopsis sp. CA-230715]|uniref:DUF3558 domain-containing protein n=1 Tax=Amycolatopsis sp. CA-230715 TaxID=2745196 RepID=UPI001C00C4C3|nr:DUF3558 domain-containing protein [Amycolatopsis sp. CA-230715]QWF80536.1 hypothetical protein HUW46_03959 [Amycolatopsis sp. CA-230715]
MTRALTSRTSTARAGVAVVAAAAVLGACGGNGGTGAQPGGQSPAPVSSPGPAKPTAAPPVPSPLKADGIVAQPCTALSSAQTQQIGMVDPQSNPTSTGPGCVWRSASDDLNKVTIAPMTANKGGLDDIYANKGAYFEPKTVNGYPAVLSGAVEDRSEGNCNLWIGVTDQLAVAVQAQIARGANKANPCPVAEKVGAAMIDNLKGGAQ